ncbi:unnamed protein product, partial [Effrenium voratum]
VIVHSGGVSSGHYYTFVRMWDSDGKTQWVKFDDECVTFCSQEAAVQDNYGGEDLNVTNYFSFPPHELRQRDLPSTPRIHNAYMLSYVRVDQEKELLTAPLLNKEEPKYRALIDRCLREAKLAEERRRARYEQMMRVEVKLMFERDLMKMKGFWPMPDEFPITETMKISRDDHTEELLRDALELPPLAQAQVQEEHIALFVLTQRKTRQLRFKYLPLSDALKCHTTDTHLTVLVMVSQGYDPQTLEPGGDSEEVPHQLSNWTEELILLVVKYFCPVKQVIVTLGCYYSELSEPLKAMLHPSSPWLAQRLLPYVQRGEVADPPATQWQCWEEWGRAPKEIKPLNIEKSMKEEGLYCGDVVIWQPLSACGPRRPGADEEEVLPTVRDFAELCMNHLRVMVRLMSAEAPLCPEGIPSQLELGQPLPPGLVRPISEATEGSQEVPGQVTCLEMTIDVRWHTDQLARKILQALQLEQAEGKRFWVFDGGAPSASRNAAMYHSKDRAPFPSLTQVGWNRAQSPRRVLHAVLLPDPPEGHSVAVHFFDTVREVGACILTMQEETNGQNGRPQGCFAVSPKKLLASARQFLKTEGKEELRPETRESIAEAYCSLGPWEQPDRVVQVGSQACEESTCFIAGVWPVLFAWFGFTLVGLSTSCNAYRHLLNFTRPDLQPHVLRIILVGPIYAFSASLCLSMSESACFFVRSVRDIWEAVVIYSFLTLIIEYMGGEHLCLHSISQNDEAVPHLFPFSLCLPPIATGSMIRVPKMGALQFVAVKPIVAVISIVVYACGQLHNWYYQWTLFVIYNISYSVALYALYLIYWSSHEQEALQSKRPLLKFVSVKMIVFLTFWQALLLPLAPLPGSSSRWEDFILSIEMIIFGVLMNIAFTWREFSTAAPCAPRLGQGAGGCVDLMDLDAKPPGNPQDAQSGAPECKDSEGSPPSSELAGAVKVHGFRGSWSLSRNRRTKHA